MMWDAQPDASSGAFLYPVLAGNGLVLAVIDDGNLGAELYAIDPGASVVGYGWGHGPVLAATDPVLGAGMHLSIQDRAAGSGAVILLGQPTTAPLMVAGSGLFFNPGGAILGISAVPAGGLNLTVPQENALLGSQLALQGFVAPGTGLLGIDFTQGLVLVFGR